MVMTLCGYALVLGSFLSYTQPALVPITLLGYGLAVGALILSVFAGRELSRAVAQRVAIFTFLLALVTFVSAFTGGRGNIKIMRLAQEFLYPATAGILLLVGHRILVFALDCRAGISALIKLPKLFRLIRVAKPQLVQCWMYHANLFGGLAAKAGGLGPIIWGIRHTSLESNKRATRLVSWMCAKLSLWIPKAIVCCSFSSSEVHQAYGYDVAKLKVICNGYDTSLFLPDRALREELRSELNLNNQQLVLGMVGRWNPQKDHDNLLCALSIIKKQGQDFVCLLIGPQMDRNNNELLSLIDSYHLQSQFKLLGSRSDIPSVMNGLDVHILSSAFGEAFPNVVAEAMACGTPCAVTDVGDAAMIVGNPEWVAPPKDPEHLANAIINILNALEREGRDAVGARCRKRIEENFSLSRMVDAYQVLWKRILIRHENA
jgi:glycosyltransferase involved in cell wall biosynthesis